MSLSDDLKLLSKIVFRMENDMARHEANNLTLVELVDKKDNHIRELQKQLEAKQAAPEAEHLLDLLQTDIEAKEKCILNDERLIEVIATYRQIRPK